jgi:hypothetical protein
LSMQAANVSPARHTRLTVRGMSCSRISLSGRNLHASGSPRGISARQCFMQRSHDVGSRA